MALYVYGVMRARDWPHDSKIDDGEHQGPPVRALDHGLICALVSEFDGDILRVRRETLLAHGDVLRRAMDNGPVLPLLFGVVMPDEAAVVHELLEPQGPRLAARLDALDGKAEMELKVTFLESPLLRSVVTSDPELARMAESVRALSDAAGPFARIRLGELIAIEVERRADIAGRELTAVLEPLVEAVSIGDRQNERMALNAAFLVDQARLVDFDAAVERLSLEHAGELQFRLIGPLPPHSFAGQEWEKGSTAWA
jgi:hypothetical protein